ncbi:hypothetical protein Sa4125_10510 [Aureimonas sp. SA4125]|uniref:hypothetical protein n=1 Tax=Aureimonas sp. SA4125 TaxID=2826993 RepID=UPI001CC71EDE|nr:hypothetical protein [Aureimonas sp. SA4125]BDA83509.1 hypothetical protein Sa4125_10510 [Aureimonas sp. SA4125]
MRRAPLIAVMSALVMLGACQSQGVRNASLAPAPVRPQGIEGSWASVGGPVAYNANFSGGNFTSAEAGTGALLASGSYRSIGPGQVTIDYTSKLRGTRVAANCNQVDVDRLACASSNGSRFEFTRRG